MWTDYCQTHGLGSWSSGAADVIAYLQTVYDRNQSISSVYQHLSVISYFHRLRGLATPTLDPMVPMFMRGLKRKNLESSVLALWLKVYWKPLMPSCLKPLAPCVNGAPFGVWISPLCACWDGMTYAGCRYPHMALVLITQYPELIHCFLDVRLQSERGRWP